MRLFRYSFLLCVCWACEKKELPVPKTTALNQNQVLMGSTYQNQVWFSLSAGKVVYSNPKTNWDLCFESGESGWRVMLNGSTSMRVLKTTANDLAAVKDTSGLAALGRADAASGHLDSTAFGNWRAGNAVYVIDQGYDHLGKRIGYQKMKIISVDNTSYIIEYASLESSTGLRVQIEKKSNKNFVAFSFSRGLIPEIEPDRTNYDLCFTNYTHLFLDPYQYYQVSGVLTNSYRTRVARLPNRNFTEISLRDTIGAPFSTARNAIGYDWKVFNLEKNQYTVDVRLCYLIQDGYGSYYKLHFIDFYDDSGVKGAPKFEFQRL